MNHRRWLPFVVVVLTCVPAVAFGAEGALRYFTPAEIAERKEYVAPFYVKLWVDDLWYVVFNVALLVLGWNTRLKAACQRMADRIAARLSGRPALARIGAVLNKLWGDHTWGGAILFVLSWLTAITLIGLPEDFYFDWWRERKHGISVEPLWRFSWDELKGFLVDVLAYSSLFFGLLGLARRKRNWWLLLGVPCALLMLGAGVLDPVRTAMFYDFYPLPDGPAKQRIETVLHQAGVEYQGVYGLKMSDRSRRANAFIEGDGPTRRIVVYDTLLKSMTSDEVANAVAHEVGHLRDRSAGRPILAGLFLIPFLYGIAWSMRRLGRGGRLGFEDDRDVAGMPVVFLFLFVVFFVSGPASAAYSRHLEYRADRYALGLLKDPESFRSMMVKLARINMANPEPPAWIVWKAFSHPPVVERIAAIEKFAEENHIPLREPTPALFHSADEVPANPASVAAGAPQ